MSLVESLVLRTSQKGKFMGSFSEHLRCQVEQYESDLAARLGRMDRGELVAWCKSEIKTHVKLLDLALESVSPKCVVVNYPEGLDIDGVLELARRDKNWCDALINEVKKRRVEGQEIPSPWRDFALDVLLKIGERPDGRGKKNFSARDDAICRCVRLLIKYTNRKATRAAESKSRDCVLCIVEDAIAGNAAWGNCTGYEGLERVWSEHGKLV
jgi:hypothetical protein